MKKVETQRLCSPFLAFLVVIGGLFFMGSEVVGQVRIVRQERLAGVVVSVGESRLTMRDEAGKVWELGIQPPDAEAVPLSTGSLLRFPADVEVEGRAPIDSLERGDLVRLSASMNRRGEVEGALNEVYRVTDSDESIGVFPTEQRTPESFDEFVPCKVVGKFQRAVKDRLLVQPERNPFTKKKVLAFSLGSEPSVLFSSEDHRKATAGSRVSRAVVAVLSTGDNVIRRLRVELPVGSRERRLYDDELEEKHRNLSNEAVDPRMVRTRHFLLKTDISERQAAILTEKLERMVGLLSEYFGSKPTGLVHGFVVHDLSRWPPGSLPEKEGVAKIKQGAGVCFSRRIGNRFEAILYACDDHGVVQHESTHAFCTMTFGSTGPTWLAEGVAEMGQYWNPDDTAMNIDPRVLGYLKNAKQKKTLGEIAVPGRTGAGDWRDYAWRWALCHLLANNPNYSSRFKPLAVSLMSSRKGASFASVYGPVKDQISFEYDQFLLDLDNGYDSRLTAWDWGAKFSPLRPGRSRNAGIAARGGWQASGVSVAANKAYEVQARGEWTLSKAEESLSADGGAGGRGRLIGAVMSGYSLSAPIELGADVSFTPAVAGDLYLRCFEPLHEVGDNAGELSVKVRMAK